VEAFIELTKAPVTQDVKVCQCDLVERRQSTVH
jgi:hypothetical protein